MQEELVEGETHFLEPNLGIEYLVTAKVSPQSLGNPFLSFF